MAWYWILAIIAGYLLVGGIIAGVVGVVERIDDGEMVLIVLGWPLFVICGIVVGVFYAFGKLGSLIVNGIVSAGEWICDSVQRWAIKREIKHLDERVSHIDKTLSNILEIVEKDDIDYDEDPISDKRRR